MSHSVSMPEQKQAGLRCNIIAANLSWKTTGIILTWILSKIRELDSTKWATSPTSTKSSSSETACNTPRSFGSGTSASTRMPRCRTMPWKISRTFCKSWICARETTRRIFGKWATCQSLFKEVCSWKDKLIQRRKFRLNLIQWLLSQSIIRRPTSSSTMMPSNVCRITAFTRRIRFTTTQFTSRKKSLKISRLRYIRMNRW